MKSYNLAAGHAWAVALVLGLSSPAAAGDQVPFKGGFEGVDTVTPLAAPFVAAEVSATGNATRLGKFTLSISATVNRTTGAATGTFEFVAANGDTVFGTLTGQSSPPDAGVLTIEEAFTITGGTGRFAGATGGFTGTRLKNLATDDTIGVFEGTISSPGAGKR